MRPRVVGDAVEQFVGRQDILRPMSSDFWRASRDGWLYLARRYREDYKLNPGTAIQIDQPIRNVAEALAHASRFASSAANLKAEIIFHVRFEGLEGRRLVDWKSGADSPWNRVIHQPTFEDELLTSVEEVEQDLAPIVHRLLEPMYESFNFFELPPVFVKRAIENLFAKTNPI